MKASDVREFIETHPEGVTIRMIDGSKYKVPNREWVWLIPPFGGSRSRFGKYATLFGVYHDDALRWVDSSLVDDIVPLEKNKRGKKPGGRRKPVRRKRNPQ